MSSIPIGNKVRQVVPVIEGAVSDKRLNVSADEVEYLVAYTDVQGEAHERWFLASQLQEITQ